MDQQAAITSNTELVKGLEDCHSYGCAATEPPYDSECSCNVGDACAAHAAAKAKRGKGK